MIIESAIDALKRGDTVSVTRLARQAASIEPDTEVAWLLLAAVASPEDSLAFVKEALQINPQSEAALEALAWAESRLPGATAEQTTPDMDASQTAGVESETPGDAPELQQEVSAQPGWTSTELEDVPITPEDETEDFDEAYPLPGEPSTELEDAPITPADESEDFVKVFSAPVESPLAREVEPTQSIEDLPAIPEQAVNTEWKSMATAAAPGQMHDPIRPASLTNSHSPAARRGKKTVFSSLLIFLISSLAVVAIAALIGLIFLRPQLSSLWDAFVAGDGCKASLVIGPQTYQIWPLKPDPDGNYDVPDKQPGRTYYVEGTSSNYVFFLSPVSENQTLMSGMQAGSPASVTWSNCATNTYRLSQPLAMNLDMPALLNQNRTGITIIAPWPGSSSGFVLKGMPENFLLPVISTPDATLETIPSEEPADETPMPINITGFSEFLAEISLLETIPSADLSSIQMSLSIYNYGNLAGRLTVSDVALTPAGGTPLASWLTEPALPLELAPGATQTLTLTFPRPSTTTATLSILNVEFYLEGY